jgi:hypothetical protein
MKISYEYVINISVQKLEHQTTEPETSTYSQKDFLPKTITHSSELTKIVQKAGTISEVKRIASGLLNLLPEED